MKSHIMAALLVLFFTGLVQAQTIERSLDSDEYQKAIDILFPLDGGEVPAFADYKIVLRVRPTFEAEYSISFAARGDSVRLEPLHSAHRGHRRATSPLGIRKSPSCRLL